MSEGKYSGNPGNRPKKNPYVRADGTPMTQKEREARRRQLLKARERRRIARRNRRIFICVALSLILIITAVAIGSLFRGGDKDMQTNQPPVTEPVSTDQVQNATEGSVQDPTEEATEPYVVTTASVGATGDILVHTPVINAAKTSDGEYDFHENYDHIRDYYSKYDLMIANFEITLGGTEAGQYTGYPIFNCPDTIIEALQAAGVDMVLTANNHMYDTGYPGLIRTQEKLNEENMPYVGSRLSEADPRYIIQEVNGIKIGMVCYTYETGNNSNGRKTLNGIALKQEAEGLVNSFDYNDLEGFYTELEGVLSEMDRAGAETNMVFIHWGNEYQLKPNDYQKTIAQKMCDMGVDVIVGGHPHVLQPFEHLVSENGHETYCIYSLGNAISNQRREKISSAPNGHTEDGMVFEIVFEKWSDGVVRIQNIDILPTWVNHEKVNGEWVYTIIPLDVEAASWDGYNVTNLSETYESYNRIMDVVGESLNQVRADLGLDAVPVSMTQP